MSQAGLDAFREIWLADFEFCQPDGHRPEPICLVAHQYPAGKTIRVWEDELPQIGRPPFPIGPDALFVAYYASAELGCFLALDWPMPARILDLFAEFRCLTNGLAVPCGNGLLGALTYYGLDPMEAAEKDTMRELAQRGGPYADAEREALLDYCETDVVALARLLSAMLPKIDLPRALLRGRYMAAAARMEWTGTPIDTGTLERLRENWEAIQGQLVAKVDQDFGVFVPTGRRLNPESRLGSEILRTAENCEIDPYQLVEAVDLVWADRREADCAQQEALKAARQRTGLTAKRITDWEHSGRDHSTWPGFDVAARELAGEYPELGIGPGYEQESGYDDSDYGSQLWELLRNGASSLMPKHDPEILRQASDMILSAGPSCRSDRLTFSSKRWAAWLARNGIPWPRLESGALDLSDETFRQMARRYPQVAPIRELRHTLSQLRLNDLAVGPDGRNRCLLSAFRARTGRNQPSNSRFIFGPSCWLRGLIQPEPGRAVAYVDWEQQEFGIAAALSGDPVMVDAYNSGDPYLTFAKQAGAVPSDATKETHSTERETFKVCALAVQYGMGSDSLAESLGAPRATGRRLLELHKECYPVFWRWSQAAVDHAMLHDWIRTVFGWRLHVGPQNNARSLSNFPMQANGAEVLRLACCLATERGIKVCAPIHDALLVEAPEIEIQHMVINTQRAMAEASQVVLDGFELRTDAKMVVWPDRYLDPRGEKMWATVMGILDALEDSSWLLDSAEPERQAVAGQSGKLLPPRSIAAEVGV